jgi:molybdopterin biosynthesis enzyme
MDGYALGTTDGAVEGSGSERVDLRVVNAAVSRAGPTVEKAMVGLMECAYVTTGAALPFGCDCVVPVEDCVISSGGQVVTVKREALSPGKWTRAIGSDVRGEGEMLIAKGERISAFDVRCSQVRVRFNSCRV